jgi:phospholipid-transporting ATPase
MCHRFTFLPAALFIQFLNLTNVFYLANVILQFQPSISTNSPLASLIPLSFVVFIGMLREFLADMKRWSEDRKTNRVTYKRLASKDDLVNGLHDVRSDQIRVGDILQFDDDQIVPTDCLLLHTVEKHGECFIQTA